MTLNDLERRNSSYLLVLCYSAEFGSFLAHCVKVVEDVVVKTFTFAILSPDEFLVLFVAEVVAGAMCYIVTLVYTYGVYTESNTERKGSNLEVSSPRGRWILGGI